MEIITMLSRNGMRQPQTRNWSPEMRLKTSTATFASSNPAGPPNCGHEVMKPRCLLVRAHSIESSTEPPPLAADAPPLDEADDGQDDGTPDADLVIGGDEADRRGGNPGYQQRGYERPLATDAVAIVAEDRGTDRPGDESHSVDRKRLQHA